MKVLIGCEYSGVVREAFKAKGHDAWSCDLLPSTIPGQHIKDDIRNIDLSGYDLGIFHPPCDKLSSAGLWCLHEKYKHKYPGREQKQAAAAELFLFCINAPIKRICVENPAGIMSKLYRPPSQIIHPFYFGDPHLKRTCLWLKNLPRLNGLQTVAINQAQHRPKPSYISIDGRNRYWTDCQSSPLTRAKTFPTVAQAMANQWSFDTS